MSRQTLYLDHAATSPLRPEAAKAWLEVAKNGLNPSSVHSLGRKGKSILEAAREAILNHTGAQGQNLVFTSGGTESNVLALHQAQFGFDRILVSAAEHDSVLITAMKSETPVEIISLSNDGTVNLASLSELLQKGGQAFVSVMLVNNETGVINTISKVAELVSQWGGWLHVDAVQALGKIEIDFNAFSADSMALSAHKIGGSQGIGALIIRQEHHVWPLITGGGQERGARSGTENVSAIAAFAAAIEAIDIVDGYNPIEAKLKSIGCTIMGEGALRTANILCFAQAEWSAQLQMMHMDMNGICVSSGSACSSGKVKESRVVKAMGFENLAANAIRVSSGWTNKETDWQTFLDVWMQGYELFLQRRALANVNVG